MKTKTLNASQLEAKFKKTLKNKLKKALFKKDPNPKEKLYPYIRHMDELCSVPEIACKERAIYVNETIKELTYLINNTKL